MKKLLSVILIFVVLTALLLIFAGCTGETPYPIDTTPIQLTAPSDITVKDDVLSWINVDNASGYIIIINDNEYRVSDASYDLSSLTDPGTYEIKVKAVGDSVNYIDSECSSYTHTVYEILETGTDELGFTYVLQDDGKSYMLKKGIEARGTVNIPDSFCGLPVTCIGVGAFVFSDSYSNASNTTIKNIVIPSTVTEIRKAAFLGLTKLTSVTIPDSVKTIGDEAFLRCPNLKTINVSDDWAPDDLRDAFAGSLWYNNQPDGLVMLGKVLYKYKGTAKGTVTIPKDTVAIADEAFMNQTNLTSVVIPDGVKLSGGSIFSGCSSLSYVKLPSDITSIPGGMFTNCSSLSDIQIPASVTKIEASFSGCSSLTNIVIPDGVTEISMLAFSGSGLETIVLPEKLSSIQSSLFLNCTSLTKVVISSTSVEEIRRDLFKGCTALSEIYFAGTVERFNELMAVNNADSMPTATVYAYSETKPTAAGNYWHYVDGVATAW